MVTIEKFSIQDILGNLGSVNDVEHLDREELIVLAKYAYVQLRTIRERSKVRTVERKAAVRTYSRENTKANYIGEAQRLAVEIYRERWLSLLDEKISVSPGDSTLWGDATVDELETRVEMLNAQINGTKRTVDLATEVIGVLRELGATTLREALK